MRNIFVVLSLICCLNPCSTWAMDNKPLENTEFQVFKAQTELKLDALKETQAKAITEATKSYTEDLNKQNVIIAAQDKRIGDLNLYLAIYAVIGGLLGIFVAIAAFLSAVSKARQEAIHSAEAWFKQNENGLLSRLKVLEDGVTAKAIQAHSVIDNTAQSVIDKGVDVTKTMSLKLNSGSAPIEVSADDKSSLNAADTALKDKPEAQYTFADWNTRAHAAYASGDLFLAENFWGQAAQMPNANDEQIAMSLHNKGITLGNLDQHEKAITSFDEVINRFSASKLPVLQEQVVMALFNKGVALGQLKQDEEAMTIYEEVISRFGTSKLPVLLEHVAKALFNKGITLGLLNQHEKAMASFDEVINLFGTSKLPVMQEQVAMALFNKGVALGHLKQDQESMAIYEEVISSFGTSELPVMQEQVAKARCNKGVILGRLNQHEEAIKCYEDVISSFSTSKLPVLQEQVAKALFNKGVALGHLKQEEKAIKSYEEVINSFGTSKLPVLQAQVEKALKMIEKLRS